MNPYESFFPSRLFGGRDKLRFGFGFACWPICCGAPSCFFFYLTCGTTRLTEGGCGLAAIARAKSASAIVAPKTRANQLRDAFFPEA
jgi:hypothetical protein